MTTTRIKEKISTLVGSQLPEFIQTDYTTFVAFLEAYYEFLEQDQGPQEVIQNTRLYADVDTSVDAFIKYFLNQYCNKIPLSALYDQKSLVKNIKALYDGKGSEKSYRLLFQILFNKKIDFLYPYDQVLKASDGKWVQKTSFFMKTLAGDGTSLINQSVLIKSPTTLYPLSIVSRKVTSTSTGIVGNTHEYFYDGSKNTPVNIGDIIERDNFRGEVVGVPAVAVIAKPGSGFKVGDILPLVSGTGNGARLKVTRVTSTGGIRNVQFINYGVGYTSNFYNFFSSGVSTPSVSSFGFAGGVASITDFTSGFTEQGTITKQDYAISYFAEDYQGDILGQFFNTSVSSGTTPVSTGSENDAAIFIQIGSKTRYPGYYSTTDGFLSDNIYLEDQDYYQPFSYVIKIDEQLSEYKKVVLDLLHPVGTKLFGELTLNVSIDSVTELTSYLRYLTSNFQEIFGIVDRGDSKHVTKIPSPDSVSTDSNNVKDVIKPAASNVIVSQLLTRSITRPLANSVILTDVSTESITKNVSFSVVITDLVTTDVINNLSLTDSSIVTDLGSLLFSDYADPTYFAEAYAGIVTTF